MDVYSKGYKRKHESSAPLEKVDKTNRSDSSDNSDSSDEEILIQSTLLQSKRVKYQDNSSSSKELKKNEIIDTIKDKDENTELKMSNQVKDKNEEIHLEIRRKLQKASGYKPDLSLLPKPPEEEFFKPEIKYSFEEKKRILEKAPVIFENRVGPNVTNEQARKAQKATFNKMLARSCGKRR